MGNRKKRKQRKQQKKTIRAIRDLTDAISRLPTSKKKKKKLVKALLRAWGKRRFADSDCYLDCYNLDCQADCSLRIEHRVRFK